MHLKPIVEGCVSMNEICLRLSLKFAKFRINCQLGVGVVYLANTNLCNNYFVHILDSAVHKENLLVQGKCTRCKQYVPVLHQLCCSEM